MELLVDNVSKTFGGAVRAVRAAGFRLKAGESLGIVGESGSGKTTLAKILAGFIAPDGGSARFGELDLLRLSRTERARHVQMVFQDPFGSINPKLPLSTQLLEAFHGVRGEERRSRAASLMADVGLSADFLARYPHQISGGQRQRFAIARALAAEPRLLIADEPVSSLDLSVQAQIVALLNRLRRDRGFSQIVISHDLAVITNTCEQALVMKDGEVVESGPALALLDTAVHPYTRRLIAAAPTL